MASRAEIDYDDDYDYDVAAAAEGANTDDTAYTAGLALKHRRTLSKAAPAGNIPMSLSFRTEEEMQQLEGGVGSGPADSNYGVYSLASHASSPASSQHLGDADGAASPAHTASLSASVDSLERPGSPPSPGAAFPHLPRNASLLSGPLTPLLARSPLRTNSSGTSRSVSLRSLSLSSDDQGDDVASQAIASDDDEAIIDSAMDTESMPQLVMPSIRMPDRRPFTNNGRLIGKLKILVAGSPGAGKTSLVKSLVQCCTDIVHVDAPNRRGQMGEVFASTRAYPNWWDLDANKGRRRSSLSEPVLERNICIVDTPGIESKEHAVFEYIEGLMERNRTTTVKADLLAMLSGNGGVQVDLVLYLLNDHLSDADVAILRRLSELTNVIPVLAKVDLLSDEEARHRVESLRDKLSLSQVRLAALDLDTKEHTAASVRPAIWPVSSTAKPSDSLDASLLSAEFALPLPPSRLRELVAAVFDPDSAAWLRHSSAKKCVAWSARRLGDSALSSTVLVSRPTLDSAQTSFRVPTAISTTVSTAPLLTLGQIQQAPDRQAHQAHMARWAADLQRSLHNERERARQASQARQAKALPAPVPHSSYDPSDPLGLLAWDEAIRAHGFAAVRLLGGCGMLGAVLVWAVRAWSRYDAHEERPWLGWLAVRA